MNKISYSKVLASTLLMGSIAQAQIVSEGQFPVLKTEKSCQLIVPEGYSASQVYFSKDCSTAFVLPPLAIQYELTEPVLLTGADDKFCLALDKVNASQAVYEERVIYLSEQLSRLLLGGDSGSASGLENRRYQIDQLRQQIAWYQKQIKTAYEPYDNMAALRGRITLTNNVMTSIRAFQEANKAAVSEEGAVYPVRFMPAHIQDSVLVVSNPEHSKYAGRTVLKVNFPGEVPTSQEGVSRDPNATYVVMNGGISGIVDLSTTTYCRNKQAGRALRDIFGNAVALNLSYKVKTQVGARVYAHAKIQTKDFLRNMQNVIRIGKFDRGEFISDVISGGLENSLTIQIDDKGGSINMADILRNEEGGENNSPVGALLGKFMYNFVTRSENKLEQMGIFSKGEPYRAQEVQNGSEDIQVGTNTVCRSSSSFFGLVRKNSCNTYPVIVKVDRDGISKMLQNTEDSSFIEELIHFETNQTVHIQHTSAFEPKR